MLFPQHNTSRTYIDLAGFWAFSPDKEDIGLSEKWYAKGLTKNKMQIAVPGAWNEQLAEKGLFNYVGAAWYELNLESPLDPELNQIILRVGAADHHATIWLNGIECGINTVGYMPFETDVTKAWIKGKPNKLTIRVDNRLSMESIPQDVSADIEPYNGPGYDRRHLFPNTRFDFFPYGGLTRSVNLLALPKTSIRGILIDSKLDGSISLHINQTGSLKARVSIIESGTIVATAGFEKNTASLKLEKVTPWCPANPFLYTAKVELLDGDTVVDTYNERFGIREIEIKGDKLLLNGEALYLTGFGKHEEFPIVGRGQFRPAYLRDFELMRWIGANSFRTSHYPYDEEIMRLADELGFLVIDEVPAVSLGFLSDKYEDLIPLLDNHKKSLKELINRDYNHPCVVSWSIANEPNLWSEPHYQNETSKRYFKEVYDFTKELDSSRPIMSITIPAFGKDDVSLYACDIIGINRYYGWYTEPGNLKKAAELLGNELDEIYEKHKKPIIVTEFGADTMNGSHSTYAQLFSEEYQTAFIKTYCDVIDSKSFCSGAHVWNFADFLTPQHFRRVVLNRKGVFTRTREPKSVAFWLRDHWLSLERINKKHTPEKPLEGFLVPDL